MVEKKTKEKKETKSTPREEEGVAVFDKSTKVMFEKGLHFGHSHSKKHPKMEPFIYGMRNNIDIIDLSEAQKCLKKTLDFLKEKKKEKALMLFVGTKVSARKLIKEKAEKLSMPYVTERWLGGTLTNFEVIKKRIDFLKDMEEKRKKGEFEKYTKKERLRIDQEIERIEKRAGGLRKLNRLPDLLFVIDVKKEKIAIEEAKKKNITIVGICDTDGDPTMVDYFIPVNDEGIASLGYILEKIEKVLS